MWPEALDMLWTSGKKDGVVDVSQQVDRMTTKTYECPCLTPHGQHFSIGARRPLTGQVFCGHQGRFHFAFMPRRDGEVHPSRVPSGFFEFGAHDRQGGVWLPGLPPPFPSCPPQDLASLAGNAGSTVFCYVECWWCQLPFSNLFSTTLVSRLHFKFIMITIISINLIYSNSWS